MQADGFPLWMDGLMKQGAKARDCLVGSLFQLLIGLLFLNSNFPSEPLALGKPLLVTDDRVILGVSFT
jgi:hypothetical protein